MNHTSSQFTDTMHDDVIELKRVIENADPYNDKDKEEWFRVIPQCTQQQIHELLTIHAPKAIDRAEESIEEFHTIAENAKDKNLLSREEFTDLKREFDSPKNNQGDRDKIKNKLREELQERANTAKKYGEKLKSARDKQYICSDDYQEAHDFFKNADFPTRKEALKMLDRHITFAKGQITQLNTIINEESEVIGKEERKTLKKELKQRTAGERIEHIKKIEAKIQARRNMQKKIRKHTDASKALCANKDWKHAHMFCESALFLLEALPYTKDIEWFTYRKETIQGIIEELERELQSQSQDPNNEENKEQGISTTQGKQQITKNTQETESEKITEERLEQIKTELIKHYTESQRATAVTVGAFIHASDANEIERNRAELQNEVDEKDNLIVDDHEEMSDEILCVESDTSRIQLEKASAIAHKQSLNTKTMAIVDSHERVVTASESDRAITKGVGNELKNAKNRIQLTAKESRLLDQSIQDFTNGSFGNGIRSEGTDGLDGSTTTFGTNFNRNKRIFAEEAANAWKDHAQLRTAA